MWYFVDISNDCTFAQLLNLFAAAKNMKKKNIPNKLYHIQNIGLCTQKTASHLWLVQIHKLACLLTEGRAHLIAVIIVYFTNVKPMRDHRFRSELGFPFFVKKLFTRNIVTDVTDGYYVGITVVTTSQKHTKLRYEIITPNKKES
jgi:hypothetical protein